METTATVNRFMRSDHVKQTENDERRDRREADAGDHLQQRVRA